MYVADVDVCGWEKRAARRNNKIQELISYHVCVCVCVYGGEKKKAWRISMYGRRRENAQWSE